LHCDKAASFDIIPWASRTVPDFEVEFGQNQEKISKRPRVRDSKGDQRLQLWRKYGSFPK